MPTFDGRLFETEGDGFRGMALISALCPDTNRIDVVVYDGPPKSKARPRLGRGHRIYTPSKPEEDALAMFLRGQRIKPFPGNVVVGAIFFRPNHQRIDVDNMLKHALDASTTAGIWKDDVQVTALLGVVELDVERPRTILAYGEHASTLSRAEPLRECAACGKPFLLEYRSSRVRFCSRECKAARIRQDKIHLGQGRGTKGRPPTACADCGRPVSKRSYVRCRDCWRAARSVGVS